MKNLIVFSPTSSIASALISEMKDLNNITFVGRDIDKMKKNKIHYYNNQSVIENYYEFDFNDVSNYDKNLSKIIKNNHNFDSVFIAHGIMPNSNHKLINETFKINSISNISIIDYFFKYFKDNSGGKIITITSVAGDLPRKKNFLYGASKSTVSFYMEGLSYIAPKNIKLIDIRPGPINTPMTANENKSILFSDPDKISKRIYKLICKNQKIIYAPFFWKYIMYVLKKIPKNIISKINA